MIKIVPASPHTYPGDDDMLAALMRDACPRIAPVTPDKALIAARDAMTCRAVEMRNARLRYENTNPRSDAECIAFNMLCYAEMAYDEAVENLADAIEAIENL